MAGTQCGDFDGKNLTTGLCLLQSGPYKDLVVYPDGRVPPTSGDMAGGEIGNCSAQGPLSSGTYAALPNLYRNSAITWSVGDLKALQRALGQTSSTASGNAFFCADDAHAGDMVINIANSNLGRVKTAIGNLEASCGSLEALHCDALIDGLRTSVGMDPRKPEESSWTVIKKGLADLLHYAPGGIAVFGAGSLVGHMLVKWWDGRGGGGGGSGGTGGTGGTAGRRDHIVEAVGDGDGAGVRVIEGDFEAAAPEPAPARHASTNDTTNEIRLFPYLMGALAAGALILASDGAATPEAEATFEFAAAAF